MIDKKELRIGNFISDIGSSDSFYGSVLSIGKKRCTYGAGFKARYSYLIPIKLTREWLLNLGFKYDKHDDYYYKNSICIEYCSISENFFIDRTGIKHVHQLQNLYFALTGEELTLKP